MRMPPKTVFYGNTELKGKKLKMCQLSLSVTLDGLARFVSQPLDATKRAQGLTMLHFQQIEGAPELDSIK